MDNEQAGLTETGTEENKKAKQHIGMKIFMPLLAGIYGTMISVMAGIPVMINESWKNELEANLVEIILLAGTFILAVKILPKKFPQVKNYSVKKPEWSVLAVIALCTPLYILIKYRLIYYGAGIWSVPDMNLMTYNSQELRADLMTALSAVVLAPIYEELSFRFIPISIYDRKWARILVGVIMAFMFAWLHGRNWIAVSVDALVYCALFLTTGNIWTNICAHSCNNLFAVILAVLTFYGAKVQMSSGSPLILLFTWKFTAVCVALAAVGIAVFALNRKKKTDTY